ncbi:MAG: thiamine S protein [bacterium]|nr:MAG: thiamine S protein [bacterium]
MAKVSIPTVFRQYVAGKDTLELEGEKVKDLMEQLTNQYPQIKPFLYSSDSKLRSFVNIYVNDEDIRYGQQEYTEVKETDEVSIIASMAGG